MRSTLATTTIAAVLLIASAFAQQPHADRFRFERPVDTAGAGPRRLAIDVALLSGAQASLADLRLFDGNGGAVPYILLKSPIRQRAWTNGAVLPVASTDKTSGFEADFQTAQPIDGIRLVGIPPPFLKRVVLEGSGDRQHWTVLAGEGTAFDLPEQGLTRTDLTFAGGTYRYVRVTWDDRNSGRVPLPTGVQARQVTELIPPPPLTARVPVERRASEPGRSRYRVRLPAANLPITAIDVIVAADAHVFRPAFVRESRLSGLNLRAVDLGRGRLTQVARDGVVAGAMRIPIESPSEPEIDVVIEDGNNPPLQVDAVSLVFDALPWIYFEAPGESLTAKYGDPTAAAPSYDLEAVRTRIQIDSVSDAAWGPPRRITPTTDGSSAVPPLPDIGAALDADLFRVQRKIPDGPAGLVALSLDASVIAESRGPDGQFADVRIIDEANRQVPYVLERRDEPLSIPVSLEPHDPLVAAPSSAAGRARSTYFIRLPYTGLPEAHLVLETSAQVFRRGVELSVERPADRNHRARWLAPIAATTWSHVDSEEAASALMLPLPRLDTTEAWLSIDEGDNTPLPLTGARLLLPSYRLRFYRRPGASLRLAYGRDDLAAPRYDLALLAPRVLGVEAQEVAPGPAIGGRAATAAEFISRRTFWVFLSTAVLVLVGLIVRLARKEDASPQA